jgi:lipopolysaccharide export system protein LptA
MHVIIYLNDGRVVNITSTKGSFNKETYDCFFENNVYANDGETEIFSDNLDLLATKNSVEIYNNVKLDYTTGSLRADKIDYDFETKYFKVSMFNDEKIQMKVIK